MNTTVEWTKQVERKKKVNAQHTLNGKKNGMNNKCQWTKTIEKKWMNRKKWMNKKVEWTTTVE